MHVIQNLAIAANSNNSRSVFIAIAIAIARAIAIANPATMRITAKVTPEQHAAWMRLGSSVWLKMMLRKATEAS